MSETHAGSADRDAARRRVRRVTGLIVAGSAAVAGSIAAYVAGASTGGKALGTTTAPPARRTEVPVPAAPAPPSLDSSAGGQAPAPSAPAQPPSQSAGPPVAVSGGS